MRAKLGMKRLPVAQAPSDFKESDIEFALETITAPISHFSNG